MALKYRDMVKQVIGSADLSLQAKAGESLLVKAIQAYAFAATYATLKIDKTTVGYFRVDQAYGNHLSYPLSTTIANLVSQQLRQNLLSWLFDKGIFTGFPVAEGETFVLSGLTHVEDFKSVIYDVYDPADLKATDINGSKATEYLFIGYGDTGAAIAAAGDNRYDNPLCPVEFPGFPFGTDVPAKTQITLHGVCGSEVAVVNATPSLAIYTRYLKMVKEREVLFDEDRNGFMFDMSRASLSAGIKVAGGHSMIGAMSHIDPRLPYMFTDPLVFDSGEELNIYVTTLEPVDASNIAVLDQVVGVIMTVKRTA